MDEPVTIPIEALSADALQGLLEEFVSRDGTDYGEYEVSTETKIQQVLSAIKNKRAAIVFDPESQSTHIINIE